MKRLAFLFAFALPAFAETRVLEWDLPTQTGREAGVRLYSGAPGAYSAVWPLPAGTTNATVTITAGSTNAFAVTQFDKAGLESAKSNELIVSIPAADPPPLAPSNLRTPFANNPPTGGVVTAQTVMDQPVQVTLLGSDPDGDSITYALTQQPKRGTLLGVAPTFTYTPLPGQAGLGIDAFYYTVSDGKSTSAPAKVLVVVSQPK